jgi:hypothetical protein
VRPGPAESDGFADEPMAPEPRPPAAPGPGIGPPPAVADPHLVEKRAGKWKNHCPPNPLHHEVSVLVAHAGTGKAP